MSGCLSDDEVIAFLGGSLPEGPRSEADEHLARCGDCRHVVAEAARGLDDADALLHGSLRGAAVTGLTGSTVGYGHTRRISALPAAPLLPGALVSRYQVVRPIGAGGSGVVYEAHDPQLGRRIALKMVRPDAAEAESRGPGRLLREAQAMARLSHPNVVNVHDAGRFEGQVFVAMEFVDGHTAAQWMLTRPPWQKVLQVFLEAGQGLAAAHAAGLIHRDFKPENVLIGNDGRVRVSDFGLARAINFGDPGVGDAANGDAPEAAAVTSEAVLEREPFATPLLTLTEAGALAGTPAYMAPEQFQAARADERSDQYNFSASLYTALYGRRPFGGPEGEALTLRSLARSVIAGDLHVPPDDGRVPAVVLRIVRRGLATDPQQRFASMAALLVELRSLLAEAEERDKTEQRLRHALARPARVVGKLVATGAVTAALAGALIVAVTRPRIPVIPTRVAVAPVSTARAVPPTTATAHDRPPPGPVPASAVTAELGATRAARSFFHPRPDRRPPERLRKSVALPEPIAPAPAPRYGDRLKDPFTSHASASQPPRNQ